MDNLTHTLVGLAAAKAGLERLSPRATAVCIMAANAPDADILGLLGGRWFYLHNHRGITHSLVGTLALALLIPLAFYLGDWLMARRHGRERRVRFKGLLLASILLSFSHPLLDWTNNYGVRPFLPWSGRWFYGDLVFIVDPWIWLSLGGAAFLLTAKNRRRTIVWAIIASALSLLVLSARLESAGVEYPNLFRAVWFSALICLALAHWKNVAALWGSRLAVGALAFLFLYWGARFFLHRGALAHAQVSANHIAATRRESVRRIAAMPLLASPLRWRCLAETDRATYLFDLTLGERNDEALERTIVRYEKPAGEQAALVARAAQDERAVIMLNFARFPVTRVEGDCMTRAIVQFADLRYTEPGQGARGSGGFAALDVPLDCGVEAGKQDSDE